MLIDILPFKFNLDTTAIAGATLWSLGLYLGFSPVSEWITEQLNRWFNFAEQFMYTSKSEFEKPVKQENHKTLSMHLFLVSSHF